MALGGGELPHPRIIVRIGAEELIHHTKHIILTELRCANYSAATGTTSTARSLGGRGAGATKNGTRKRKEIKAHK